MRTVLILVLSVALCAFLDRSDIRGFGFDFLEAVSRSLQVGFATRWDPDLVSWARQQIVLVPISESTCDPNNPDALKDVFTTPVPRDRHAIAIDKLTKAGASVIAFDLIFDLPSVPERDDQLARAAKRSGRVLWASLLDEKAVPPELIQPIPLLLHADSHQGHVNVPQNSEQPRVDAIRPAVGGDGQPVTAAFGIEAALMKLGLGDAKLQWDRNGWHAGPLTIPVDENGYAAISYRGWVSDNPKGQDTSSGAPYKTLSGSTTENFFPRVPYEDLFNGKADWKLFRNKIVIIGDITAIGNDFRNTTIGYMWGPEIHAHVVSSLLMAQRRQSMVRPASPWANFLVLAGLSLLVCLLAAIWRLQWAALAAVGLLTGYYVLNLWAFAHFSLALHSVAPAASVTLVLLGMLTERGLTEESEKRRMKTLLQRYMSEELAEYVTAYPEKSYLGGERVTATVLFSDIRGFTSISEQLPPEDVLRMLNEYMEAMTEIVYRHRGFVDKFIGDGIMALFGVPTFTPDHAARAVAAAIDMQEELMKFQQIWLRRGLPLIDIGIGINTGDMVFGNYGSNRRSDFSVIGDAVNLASRVEAQNKEWGTRILITDATYEYVRDRVQVRGPLVAEIRGKAGETVLHELLGWTASEVSSQDRSNRSQFPKLPGTDDD